MAKQTFNLTAASVENEIAAAINDWFIAFYELHRGYDQLKELINQLARNETPDQLANDSCQRTLIDLKRLMVELVMMLSRLENDMGHFDEGASPMLKMQKLRTHADSIAYWNNTIKNALRTAIP